MHKLELDTPALLVELGALERNLQRMADFVAVRGLRLRPHAKIYRATPELAWRQLEAGAIGITCAKLAEAEVLAAAGVGDILIANQVVGARKVERLLALAKVCDVKVAVDSPENAAELAQAARSQGVRLGVLLEVNIGHNRCGVAPGAPALQLAQFILRQPGLQLRGLMGYDGHCTARIPASAREALSIQANTLLAGTRQTLADAGIPVEIVSGSGTVTYRYASQVAGLTEIQAGTYLLMDTAFRESGVEEFELTLSVLATVISRPSYPGAEDLAIIDTGRKSISPQLGLPEVKTPPGAQVFSLSDEHGRVRLAGEAAASPPRIGDKIELWVRDANGTINQFDRFYAIRAEQVEAIWPIPAGERST
jgi:D-serine deaminase-like pyridoxal phosphate-dependent protein